MKNKTPFYVLFCIAIVFVLYPISAKGQSENSAWPMFHGSAQHGGQSPYDTSSNDGTIIWTFETEDGIEAGPIIGADGTIYIASHDGYLYAVNPDGSEKWRFSAGEQFWDSNYGGQYKSMMATPAIDDAGTVYVYSSDHHLIAVNSDGTEKWRFKIVWLPDFWSSPVIGADGTIYIGSARDDETDFIAGLYAINPDGTLKWIHDEGTGVTTPPAIGSDGTIYIGAATPSQDKSKDDTGKILAISPEGEQMWRFDVELWVEGASTVGPDGNIYSVTKEGDIYAISPQGEEIWKFSTGDGVSASPAIGSDGTIYVGSWDCYFYAIDSYGEQKWSYKTPDTFEGISSPAAIGSDGTIYVGSNSGWFYAFNPNGTLKWNLGPFGPIVAGPAISEDGAIYFASWDKHLYAIGFSPEDLQNDTETIEIPEPEPTPEPEPVPEPEPTPEPIPEPEPTSEPEPDVQEGTFIDEPKEPDDTNFTPEPEPTPEPEVVNSRERIPGFPLVSLVIGVSLYWISKGKKYSRL
jgi:outer membrane protein assembly factor BamB